MSSFKQRMLNWCFYIDPIQPKYVRQVSLLPQDDIRPVDAINITNGMYMTWEETMEMRRSLQALMLDLWALTGQQEPNE